MRRSATRCRGGRPGRRRSGRHDGLGRPASKTPPGGPNALPPPPGAACWMCAAEALPHWERPPPVWTWQRQAGRGVREQRIHALVWAISEATLECLPGWVIRPRSSARAPHTAAGSASRRLDDPGGHLVADLGLAGRHSRVLEHARVLIQPNWFRVFSWPAPCQEPLVFYIKRAWVGAGGLRRKSHLRPEKSHETFVRRARQGMVRGGIADPCGHAGGTAWMPCRSAEQQQRQSPCSAPICIEIPSRRNRLPPTCGGGPVRLC